MLWRKKWVFLNEKPDTKAIHFTPQVTLNFREDTLVYKSWLSKRLKLDRQLHLCLHWAHMCVCAHTVLECAIKMDTFELGRYIGRTGLAAHVWDVSLILCDLCKKQGSAHL